MFFWKTIGTFFGCGYFPRAPGTFTSLVTVIILWFIPQVQGVYLLAAAVIVTLTGIPAGTKLEKIWDEDPSRVTIDEAAGMLITLIWIPHSLFLFILGFILFRFFDIAKPFPIDRLQKLHGGVGIMIDDVLAGFYAQVILRALVLTGWYF